MATPILQRSLRGKTHRSNIRRMLAIEQCEARWVMDHAFASAAFGMSGGDAYFEGSTVTIQNGNDLFVVDVNQGVPVIRSSTSLRSSPTAVALEEKELTLVISSQMGLSEILVYDLSDPTKPVVKQTQSVDGCVTRAWIADQKIFLQTIDPNDIPEAIPLLKMGDLNSVFNLGSGNTEVDTEIDGSQQIVPAIWGLGEMESGIPESNWSMPDPTLQVYDRTHLNLGAILKADQCGVFDELVVLPDGIVTIATSRLPQNYLLTQANLDSDKILENQQVKWVTSTRLSRWSYDELGSSLELAGSYIIEDGYSWSELKTTVQDGVTSLFLLMASESGNWDVRLHRFRLGSEQSFEHSDLKLTEYLDQNWLIDFSIDQETGVIATSTKLISVDLMADSSPTILATRTFTGSSSNWKHLESQRWLRISNPYNTEGNLDGTSVSLEIFEITDEAIEPIGSETKIAGEELFWSCFGPDSITYLEKLGIIVMSMQRFQKVEEFTDDVNSSQIVDDTGTGSETDLDLLPSVMGFPQEWFYEVHLLRIEGEEGIDDLGHAQIDTSVTDIGESQGHVVVVTDRELIMIDPEENGLTRTALALVPTICPVDVLGIDSGHFVKMLNRIGLSFMESMMDNRGNFVDLELERIATEGLDEVIHITVGNESWQIKMWEKEEPELVTSQFQDSKLTSYSSDVNGDGEVDSIDAKILMERLNQRGYYPAPTISMGDEQQMVMDINRDGWLSALDPLIVINRINGFGDGDVEISFEENAVSATQLLAPVLQAIRSEDLLSNETVEAERAVKSLRIITEKWIDPVATDHILEEFVDWSSVKIVDPIEENGLEADQLEEPLSSFIELADFESSQVKLLR